MRVLQGSCSVAKRRGSWQVDTSREEEQESIKGPRTREKFQSTNAVQEQCTSCKQHSAPTRAVNGNSPARSLHRVPIALSRSCQPHTAGSTEELGSEISQALKECLLEDRTCLCGVTGMTMRAPPALKTTVPFVPCPEDSSEGALMVTLTAAADFVCHFSCSLSDTNGWLSNFDSSSSHLGVASMRGLLSFSSSWQAVHSEAFLSALETISCSNYSYLSLAYLSSFCTLGFRPASYCVSSLTCLCFAPILTGAAWHSCRANDHDVRLRLTTDAVKSTCASYCLGMASLPFTICTLGQVTWVQCLSFLKDTFTCKLPSLQQSSALAPSSSRVHTCPKPRPHRPGLRPPWPIGFNSQTSLVSTNVQSSHLFLDMK